MLMSNAAVSFDLSGVPFVGDNIDTSLQFSKTVPRDKEMNHCNQKHYRRTGWRRKAKSRVSIRQYDHGAPVRVGQHYFSSLDQNPKTRFLLTSSFNNEPFSASFEAARSCKIPSPEKVDSALDNKKITNLRHCRRFRKRGKGGRYDVTLTAFSLQLQSDFNANHSSAIRIPANLDSPNCSDIGKRGKEINMAREQKMKCLKSEVHKSHSADTASLPGSFVHKVGRALRSPFRKKLLVLDLNGILCDVVLGCHRSCLPHKQVNRRSVFKRPFLNDFLSFCFERFVVGIWSSRNKYNVMGVVSYVMGDSKDRLLFCWDQSKCTVTGFNTIENRHKPLMLKELTKLWNKEEASLPWEKGEFSPSNTLLVDDSPYKALCNPLHTAIFPFPYDFQHEGDSALGPGGAIRVYLESIAMADDVQEHVKKHSFGQGAITSKDQMWSFYKNVIDKKNSMASR